MASLVCEVLKIPKAIRDSMIAHCIDGLPDEACGLVAAASSGASTPALVEKCYLTKNAARSAKLYAVDPLEHLKADRDAESNGLEIVGVFHSHTHTEAYPSPTDVAQAPDPTWHYILISLKREMPVVRSYLIRDGKITEEEVVVVG